MAGAIALTQQAEYTCAVVPLCQKWKMLAKREVSIYVSYNSDSVLQRMLIEKSGTDILGVYSMKTVK